MKEIIYVKDPDDRVSMRCFDQSGDGVTACTRRKGHPNNTIVFKKVDESEDEYKIEFNHRGQKAGRWYAW